MGANIAYRYLNVQTDPPVATLTLSWPENGNLINAPMAEEIGQACQEISEDERLALVVLTGAGDCFSVGQDLPIGGASNGGAPTVDSCWINDHSPAAALAGLPIPVIVAINGDALDHGLEVALAGDIRVAATEARFGLTGLGMGVLPWDGGTQRLPRLVGPSWARDMLLTGRVIDSNEALAIGLVNRVTPRGDLMAETQQLVESIASGGPLAARFAKEAVMSGLDLSLSQGLVLEADLNVILHSTGDRVEGIRSFLERRPPRFSGS